MAVSQTRRRACHETLGRAHALFESIHAFLLISLTMLSMNKRFLPIPRAVLFCFFLVSCPLPFVWLVVIYFLILDQYLVRGGVSSMAKDSLTGSSSL